MKVLPQDKFTESKIWGFDWDNQEKCKLKNMQCIAICKSGDQCSRKTTYTLPYCFQHLKSKRHLRIGRTLLINPKTKRRYRFRGLFACGKGFKDNVIFKKDDIIIPYVGEKTTEEKINKEYDQKNQQYEHTVPYGIHKTKNGKTVFDAACVRGVAAFANKGERKRGGVYANAKFTPGEARGLSQSKSYQTYKRRR